MTTLAHLDADTFETIDDRRARTLIAREGSALAATLRERGWIARAGWRTSDDNGQSSWQIRFERPDADEPAC